MTCMLFVYFFAAGMTLGVAAAASAIPTQAQSPQRTVVKK